MITDDYKGQLQQMRDEEGDKKWGITGARNFGAPLAAYLLKMKHIVSVLDFGAGQGSLGKYIKAQLPHIEWYEYDPGVKGIDEAPTRKFDLIVSSDVLEHIEPEEIDNVLDWCADHAIRGQYHHIACFPAGGTLPDGRNKHLIVENAEWWVDKFERGGWDIQFYSSTMRRKRSAYALSCQIQTDKL